MVELPESELPKLKHRDSVEIYVALPDLKRKECPLFSFMDNEWKFRFEEECYGHGKLGYSASIIRMSKKALFKSFKFSYHVEIVDGPKVTVLYPETYVNLNNDQLYSPFLEIPDTMLHDKIPYNHSGRNIFKFSFTVYLPSEPVMKLKLAPEKIPKKVSYSNADVSMASLSKDFSELFTSGQDHDVKIKCGEYTLKLHRLILFTRSKVFKTMLQKNFLEGRTGFVEIRDMDSSTFLDFIKYIYTDLLPELTFEKAMTLYETGDKYDVRSLSMRCSDYLQDNLSPENVYRCIVLADAHSDEKLKSEAIAYILRNKLDLQDENWLPFCDKYPKIAFEVYKLSRKSKNEE